jgi:hypothetical protein
VAVVDIRVVGMVVAERNVRVPMRVDLGVKRPGRMLVPVVLVVPVSMLVFQRLVDVFVPVAFRQVKTHPDTHADRRDDELHCQSLVEDDEACDRTDERSGREVGAGARTAEVSQSKDEEDQARSVRHEAYHAGGHDEGGARPRGAASDRHDDIHNTGRCTLRRRARERRTRPAAP